MKLIRKISLLIFLALMLIKGSFIIYHRINKSQIGLNDKVDLSEIMSSNPKLIFIETNVKNGLFEPPFGNIHLIDLKTKKHFELNYDGYYDRNPTFSKKDTSIYFESKRDTLSKQLHLGSKNSIYKLDLKTNEISNYRSYLTFALNDTSSSIESPRISPYDSRYFCFKESGLKGDSLLLIDEVSKKVLHKESTDSISDYWFINNYLLIRYYPFIRPIERYSIIDLTNGNSKNVGDKIKGTVLGFSESGDDIISIKKINDSTRAIVTTNIKTAKIDTLYIKYSNDWKKRGQFSSIKWFLPDTSLIIEEYLNDSGFSNVLMFKNDSLITLRNKQRKRFDYYVWY